MFSATKWGAEDDFPYHPFSLDSTHREMSSTYEIDIVVDEVRYTYGFESISSGVSSEWLYSYPARRRRVLFERKSGQTPEMSFGRSLVGENATISKLTRPTALFLSVAANNNHPVLKRIHHEICQFKYARYTEQDKRSRIRLATSLIKDTGIARQAQALLRFADLGIKGVELNEKDLGPELRKTFERVLSAISGGEEGEGSAIAEVDKYLEGIRSQIRFIHSGGDSDSHQYGLEMSDQSAGTVAWLSIGVPALVSLEAGDVFMVDEIDSSLHPRLTAALIHMFKDPAINPSGAQLIFTSHDSSLMGKMLDGVLASEEIWFTEKRNDGATELYALEEFAVRKNENFELRYLQGRYGAIPMIDSEDLRLALVGRGENG